MQLGKWKLNWFKALCLLLFAGTLGVIGYRVMYGLGASTGLNDTAPWGLWKAFDVVVIVPLGGAGFTMAFVRYFLNDARYELIARRSVIWAAIAYISMGARLMFDIGLPWRLANPLIFGGNIHSALFEVAWCVALYLIVLFFENLPRVAERIGSQKAASFEHNIHKILPFFVLFGIMLSSMHQASLGTLFMIVGKRIDPLWYHPWLNYIFLLTAVAAGLSVAVVIEGLTATYYKTKYETALLGKLLAGVAVFLGVAFVWRIGVLVMAGTIGNAFTGSTASLLWWAEQLALFVVPLVILASTKLRNSRTTQQIAAWSTVVGMVMLRLNVTFTGMAKDLNMHYTPTWMEWLFTIGFTAGTIVAFTVMVELLPGILGERAVHSVHSEALKAAADD
ncbi:MAG TPA: NrfD/PsrC family molybdoenzyme membrane anchor subunit [Symbiobacteriaceae bacterium]|jgi:Ni/Fe-hydrogenase subunit HybB-like protein